MQMKKKSGDEAMKVRPTAIRGFEIWSTYFINKHRRKRKISGAKLF